jgi:transcriptional regulator with XRE-family HTH domain
VNEVQLGSALRRIRVRLGLRQADVADRAGVAQVTVSRVERGHVTRMQLARLARIAAALEADIRIDLRWRGGELPALLNAGHAAMHEEVARGFRRLAGWMAVPEASFSIYGERGIVDVLAFHPESGSFRRVAPRVARDRGWRVRSVSACVLLRSTPTNRRRVAQHRSVLRAAFPDDGRGLRRWLRQPEHVLSALAFLSYSPGRNASARTAGIQRVRARTSSVAPRAADPGSG